VTVGEPCQDLTEKGKLKRGNLPWIITTRAQVKVDVGVASRFRKATGLEASRANYMTKSVLAKG
jgi:hypothetical protein